MSSYANIYVNGKEVFTDHNGVDPETLYLFLQDEFLLLRGNEATKYEPDWDIDDMSPEEIEELEILVCAAPAGVLKDRLNVLGFGETLLKEVFEEELNQHIKRTASFAQRFNKDNDPVLIKELEEEINDLQKLTYDTWIHQLDAYISSKISAMGQEDPLSQRKTPFKYLSDLDQKIILRAIVEHVHENDMVTLDLTELEEVSWINKQDNDSAIQISWNFISSPPIVITEGIYDVKALKGAIEILKPHLAPYIRFLDYEFRPEGGAPAAVSTLKSFAAAGISSRIVAIFDNDSAAREAVTALKGMQLPPQYKVIHYPDINLANEYPTLGPQGDVTMNVNGLAGSIELYLGTDVLKDAEGNLMPVQWKGYMSKIKSYQGELLNKFSVQRAFDEKLKAAKTNRQNVDKQDWSGLSAILDKLVETLSNF